MSVWMAPLLYGLAGASVTVALAATGVAELLGLSLGGPRGASAAAGWQAVALWALASAIALTVSGLVASRRRWSRWVYPLAWEPLGFSRAEARRWARWRFRPPEALAQRGQGRTPSEAAVAWRLLEGGPVGAFLAAASEVTSARSGEGERP